MYLRYCSLLSSLLRVFVSLERFKRKKVTTVKSMKMQDGTKEVESSTEKINFFEEGFRGVMGIN